MNISKLFNITRKSALQPTNGRATRAIAALREVGYTMPEIRAGLIKMHGINLRRLASERGDVGRPVLYKVASSRCTVNAAARAALAAALDVEEEVLFPQE